MAKRNRGRGGGPFAGVRTFYSPGDIIPTRDAETGLFLPLNLPVRHYEIDGRPYVLLTPEDRVKKPDLVKPREDDVLVATYPRNGTGLTLNLVTEIHKAQNPDLPSDHPFFNQRAKDQTPWIHNKFHSEAEMEDMPSPRAFKTHNYYQHLGTVQPGQMKMIHVFRNPKDVVCSHFYHMTKLPQGLFDYKGSFEEAVEYFLDGGFETGCYWRFNREYLENKDGHTILHLHYEELTMRKREGVKKINTFLGYPDLKEDQMEGVVRATTLDYDNLRSYQVGKPGKGVEMLTKEQRERFDERTRKEFEEFKNIPESFFSDELYVGQLH